MNELSINPKQQIMDGRMALAELKAIVQRRKDKLVINGKQYLYFTDYQMLGAFFGITSWVVETKELTREKLTEDGSTTLLETIGFHARAIAKRDGQEISAAEAECLFEEKNWTNKPRFTLLSMAQTRACAKALRNVLSWIVKMPDNIIGEETQQQFAEEAFEEL